MAMDWTPEKIEKMCEWMGAGKTAAYVAREFGCTRNAVIGKYQRERVKRGIIPPFACESRPRPHRTRPILEDVASGPRINAQLLRNTTPKRECEPTRHIPEVAKVSLGFILPALPVASRGPAVGILDVTGCRWPVADDPEVIGGKCFCNAEKRDGSAYCHAHARASVAPDSRELIRSTVRFTLSTLRRGERAA